MQHQRRGFGLAQLCDRSSGTRRDREETAASFRPRLWAHSLATLSKMRIRSVVRRSETSSGRRVGEIFVIADAEAVAFHDDVTAEAGSVVVECDDGSTLFGCEDWIGDSVPAGGKRFLALRSNR